MEAIKKFQMRSSYYPVQRRSGLFRIKARFGKELLISVVKAGVIAEELLLNVSLTADEHGAYEYFLYDGMRIPAYNQIKEIKLSPEEEEYVTKVIEHDIEMRKAKGLDNAEITTVSDMKPFVRKGRKTA